MNCCNGVLLMTEKMLLNLTPTYVNFKGLEIQNRCYVNRYCKDINDKIGTGKKISVLNISLNITNKSVICKFSSCALLLFYNC